METELKQKILNLYPDYDSIYEPYNRPDGRKHIILRKGFYKNSPQKTISYSKVLLEVKLNRKLEKNETADHDDEDKSNNDIENIKLLSREENARKAMNNSNRKEKIEECKCSWCGKIFLRPLRFIKRMEKKNMSGPFCDRICARRFQSNN